MIFSILFSYYLILFYIFPLKLKVRENKKQALEIISAFKTKKEIDKYNFQFLLINYRFVQTNFGANCVDIYTARWLSLTFDIKSIKLILL